MPLNNVKEATYCKSNLRAITIKKDAPVLHSRVRCTGIVQTTKEILHSCQTSQQSNQTALNWRDEVFLYR